MADKGLVEGWLKDCEGALSWGENSIGRLTRDDNLAVREAVVFLVRAVRALNERMSVVVVESGPRRTTCRLDLLPDYHREALAEIGRLEGRIREALFVLKNSMTVAAAGILPISSKDLSNAIAHLEGAHDVK